MASFRPVGPFNGVLPAATNYVYGFMRDPKKAPFLEYAQMVPAPIEGNGLFRYCTLEPDEPTRMVSLDEFAWGFDDPVPSGLDFMLRAKWDSAQTGRWAFPYTIGDRTASGWQKGAGLNLQSMYDKIRLSHAMLHRATRVVAALRGASWPAYNTSTLNALLGTSGVGFDLSSGEERLPSGAADPNFQIIKKTLNVIMRRIDLATNGALRGEEEFMMVMGPRMAQKMSESGEIVNYLKQQVNAGKVLMGRNGKWEIPEFYQGWKFVVEDTPRCTIRMNADGTVADLSATSPTQKDYLWTDDSIAFVSRPGGLDGGYGQQNFSTVQVFTYDGPGAKASGLGDGDLRAGTYVKAEADSWNELTRGAIVTEDVPLVPVPSAGFYLTGALSTG